MLDGITRQNGISSPAEEINTDDKEKDLEGLIPKESEQIVENSIEKGLVQHDIDNIQKGQSNNLDLKSQQKVKGGNMEEKSSEKAEISRESERVGEETRTDTVNEAEGKENQDHNIKSKISSMDNKSKPEQIDGGKGTGLKTEPEDQVLRKGEDQSTSGGSLLGDRRDRPKV